MNPGERLRLFVAADVPTSALAPIDARTAELRMQLPEARWTPASNQHVTLKFLGATPAEEVDAVSRVCALVAAGCQPASVRLTGFGAFPSARRARVLWIGIEDPDGILQRLAIALDRDLEPLGFAAEERPYRPHLTLARLKSPARVADLLTAAPAPGLQPFAIDHVSLYRSRLSPRGAQYELLQQFALA